MRNNNKEDSGKLKDILTIIPLLSNRELEVLIEEALRAKNDRGRKNIDTIRLS